MNKIFISVLSVALLLVSSCAIDNINDENGGKEGTLSLILTQNKELVYKGGQKGNDLFVTPDIADFKVLVFNSKNEQYASFPKFADMPSKTCLKEGSYTIVASHGANPPAAFNAPYFEGKSSFSIKGSDNTPLDLTCKVANVLVSVSYTDKFKAIFDQYSLDLMTEYTVNEQGDYESLRFVGDDKRVGFVRVAPIVYLSVSLHKKSTDKSYRYGVTPLKDVKGGEYYKLIFDTDVNGNAIVSITMNDETQNKPIDVALGEEYLPKLPPVVKTTFNSDVPYSVRYGFFEATTPLVAFLKAQGDIKSVIMEVNSEYAAHKGVPSIIDFSAITPETEAALKALGVEYTPMIGAKSGRLNFTKMLSTLDNYLSHNTSQHVFNIKITDTYNRTTSKEIAFEVRPLIINMGVVHDYDIWANHGKFSCAKYLDCTPEEEQKYPIKYEYSTSDGKWYELRNYTIDANGDVILTKLNDNTTYKVRATAAGAFSDEILFKTEEARNLPNASFEEFYQEKYATNIESVIYYPYAKGEGNPFWQTLNPMTTRDKSNDYYKSYPCALIVDDASNGNKAIKLYTVGWGSGSSTPIGIIPRPSATIPGKLFIGDFVESEDWNSGNKSMKQGKPFASRPISIDFDYKYTAYNTVLGSTMQVRASLENRAADGTVTVIATGSFDWFTKGNSGGYKTQNIVLNYTNMKMKATHISLSFQSQEDKNIGITELKGIDENGSKRTTGSYLFIDNIVLKY
ncbi:MAG: DUF4493 domain-containing protein [Rikenellaceae bacterium]